MGLVTSKFPTEKTGGRSKLFGPGATKPSAVSTEPPASVTCVPLLLFFLPSRQSVEPSDRHVDAEPGTQQDPDDHEERCTQPPVREPAEAAVQHDARGQISECVPGVSAGRWRRLRMLPSHRAPDNSSVNMSSRTRLLVVDRLSRPDLADGLSHQPNQRRGDYDYADPAGVDRLGERSGAAQGHEDGTEGHHLEGVGQ